MTQFFSVDDLNTDIEESQQERTNEINIVIDNTSKPEGDTSDEIKITHLPKISQRDLNSPISVTFGKKSDWPKSPMKTSESGFEESHISGSQTLRLDQPSYQKIIISESKPKESKEYQEHRDNLSTLYPARIRKLFTKPLKSHLTFAKKSQRNLLMLTIQS